MGSFRRIALAAALLSGGIAGTIVTGAGAAGNGIPFFTSVTPLGYSIACTPGVAVEFDVQGFDHDGAPVVTVTSRNAATSAQSLTVTPVADLDSRFDTVHVSFLAASGGSYSLRAYVDDGIAHASRTLTIDCVTTNLAPTIDAAPADSGSTPAAQRFFGQPYSFTLQGSDPDTDEELQFTLQSPVPGASIAAHPATDPTSAQFNFDPTAAGAGDKVITVVLTDDNGATDTQTFTIRVLGKQPTALFANPALVAIPGAGGPLPLTVSARLYGLGGAPLAGRPVGFFLRGNFLCVGVTNASGYASCQAVISAVLATLNLDYDAVYAGDAVRFGSADDGQIIGLLGLPLP